MANSVHHAVLLTTAHPPPLSAREVPYFERCCQLVATHQA